MKPVDQATPSGVRRQQLLRCVMLNAFGEASIRYVEPEHFKLWEFMMRSRHSLTVASTRLGMWLPLSDFEAHVGPFSHSGEAENAVRLTIRWFNSAGHHTVGVERYVRERELESVKRILLSHVPPSARDSGSFELDEVAGVCVSRPISEPEVQRIVGLSGIPAVSEEERHWLWA